MPDGETPAGNIARFFGPVHTFPLLGYPDELIEVHGTTKTNISGQKCHSGMEVAVTHA
jgi:hypothetical protein